MPTEFSAVQVRAGLYLVVTSRCRGSTGVATGAPRYTSPSPSTRYCAAKTIVAHVLRRRQPVDPPDELDVPRGPGRVGADAVHVPLDGEPGRRVVPGQRQPHGARRHAQLVRRGQLVLGPLQQRQQRPRGQPRGVGVDLQRPDARRQVDDPGQALAPPAPPAGRAPASAGSGRGRDRRTRRSRCRRRRGGRPRPACRRRRRAWPGRRRRRRRRRAPARAWRAGRAGTPRPPRAPARSARCHPGRSCPIFHSSPLATTAGQTNPPRLGPSGPRMIGVSPVKSSAPTA